MPWPALTCICDSEAARAAARLLHRPERDRRAVGETRLAVDEVGEVGLVRVDEGGVASVEVAMDEGHRKPKVGDPLDPETQIVSTIGACVSRSPGWPGTSPSAWKPPARSAGRASRR